MGMRSIQYSGFPKEHVPSHAMTPLLHYLPSDRANGQFPRHSQTLLLTFSLFFALSLHRFFVASLFRTLAGPRTRLVARMRASLESAFSSADGAVQAHALIRLCTRAARYLAFDLDAVVLPLLCEIFTLPTLHSDALPQDLKVHIITS